MLVSFKKHEADKLGIFCILLLVLFCLPSLASSENHIKRPVIDIPAQFEQDVSGVTEKDQEPRQIQKKIMIVDLHGGVVRKIPVFTLIQSVCRGASANTSNVGNTVNTATDNTIEDEQLSIVLEKSKVNDAIIHLSVTQNIVKKRRTTGA